jgi:GntR family transcriptional regulator / MocR family aminotransferase
MDVHITLGRRGELSVQIYRQLLGAILDGRLSPGDRLPPTRELAQRLGVSRNTAAVAYEQLTADGVLTGRVGSGSYVSERIPLRHAMPRRAPAGTVQPLARWQSMPPSIELAATASAYDFSVGIPDAKLFPYITWRRLLANEWRSPIAQHARYGSPEGHAGLRAAIARHIGLSRAVRADASDVIVTQGAQQAFDVIGRVLIADGTYVAVEDPGYPLVQRLFRSLGAKVVGVPVDEEGLRVEAIPRHASLVYVTPSHQFPLGVAMSLRRRAALLAWAERRGAVVIEDDYDSEFRFDGRPLDPLQSLDRTGRVIYVGSFSKVLLPTLRMGFLVAPASLRSALLSAKQLTDWHGDLIAQAALALFIDRGLLGRHIRKVMRVYAARHARILESLERRCGGRLRAIPSAAGLHLTAEAEGTPAYIRRVVDRARGHGVRVGVLSDYAFGTSRETGIVIGYGAIPASRIDDGLRQLAAGFV